MSLSSRIFATVAVVWVTASPLLWWNNISGRYGAQIPLEFMVQLAVLGVVGVLALPALWRGVRWASWSTIGVAFVVVLSQYVFPSAMPSGLLLNGVILCAAALLTLRSNGRLRRPLS